MGVFLLGCEVASGIALHWAVLGSEHLHLHLHCIFASMDYLNTYLRNRYRK